MNTILSYFLAARPKTLTAGVIPIWAGCMIVWRMRGSWDLTLALYTLGATLCLQIACNFFNDAIDFKKNADTHQRTGPKRMTAGGRLSPAQVLLGAACFLALACALAWPLYTLRGWPIIAIGLPSLYFAYGYTGGPFPLAYKGLGEVFVILFFGLVAVTGTILVQIGFNQSLLYIYHAGIVIGMQCGLLSAVMIAVNNIRDREEDATTGKRTLAVRMGDSRARRLAMAFIVASYITLPTAFRALGMDFSEIYLTWIPAILAAGILILFIKKTPAGPAMNKVLGMSSLHLIIYLVTYTFC